MTLLTDDYRPFIHLLSKNLGMTTLNQIRQTSSNCVRLQFQELPEVTTLR